jgi:hypothetical protein
MSTRRILTHRLSDRITATDEVSGHELVKFVDAKRPDELQFHEAAARSLARVFGFPEAKMTVDEVRSSGFTFTWEN